MSPFKFIIYFIDFLGFIRNNHSLVPIYVVFVHHNQENPIRSIDIDRKNLLSSKSE